MAKILSRLGDIGASQLDKDCTSITRTFWTKIFVGVKHSCRRMRISSSFTSEIAQWQGGDNLRV